MFLIFWSYYQSIELRLGTKRMIETLKELEVINFLVLLYRLL